MALEYGISLYSHSNTLFTFVTLTVRNGFSGTPQARIYLEGSTPPAFSNMSVNFYYEFTARVAGVPLPYGTYIVEYSDSNGVILLGKAVLAFPNCFTTNTIFTASLSSSKLYIYVEPDKPISVPTIADWQALSARKITLDNGASYQDGIYYNTTTANSKTEYPDSALNIFETIDIKVKRNNNACEETWITDFNLFNEPVYTPLALAATKSNVTAYGGSDGEIILYPSGGSGSYTYLWADGPTVQNRTGLVAGTYSVLVSDTVTLEQLSLALQITEPGPPPAPDGSILEVPILNSLFFIVSPIAPDNISSFQGLDNTMFCKQRYGLFEEGRYYQKVCKVDTPLTQFNSDFANNDVALLNSDGDVLQIFPVTMVVENIGRTITYPISIQYHATGKSRVYFASGNPPIPMKGNDSFEVLNNLDGFNGGYIVTDIIFDSLKGYSFLVINLNYSLSNPVSIALGRFTVNTAKYNVFESSIAFSSFDEGIYQVKIRAYNANGIGEKVAYSEPILLKEAHPDTSLIEYRNFDNAYNMVWSLGYIGRKRVESILGHRRLPGGIRSITRNSSYDLIKTSSKMTRGIPFEVIDITPYLFEVLCCIIQLDFFMINKIEFQTEDSFTEPQFQDKYLLLNSTVRLEQIGWFRTYNNDDVGSVNDTGFIISDGGLIKSS